MRLSTYNHTALNFALAGNPSLCKKLDKLYKMSDCKGLENTFMLREKKKSIYGMQQIKM